MCAAAYLLGSVVQCRVAYCLLIHVFSSTQINSQALAFYSTYIPMEYSCRKYIMMNEQKTKRIHAAHLLCVCVSVLFWHGQVKIIDYAILPVTF